MSLLSNKKKKKKENLHLQSINTQTRLHANTYTHRFWWSKFETSWFVGLVLWYINHFCLFNAKSCFNIYIKYIFVNTFLDTHNSSISNYQIEQKSSKLNGWFSVLLCITNNSIKHQSFVHTHFKFQRVLFNQLIGPRPEWTWERW